MFIRSRHLTSFRRLLPSCLRKIPAISSVLPPLCAEDFTRRRNISLPASWGGGGPPSPTPPRESIAIAWAAPVPPRSFARSGPLTGHRPSLWFLHFPCDKDWTPSPAIDLRCAQDCSKTFEVISPRGPPSGSSPPRASFGPRTNKVNCFSSYALNGPYNDQLTSPPFPAAHLKDHRPFIFQDSIFGHVVISLLFFFSFSNTFVVSRDPEGRLFSFFL